MDLKFKLKDGTELELSTYRSPLGCGVVLKNGKDFVSWNVIDSNVMTNQSTVCDENGISYIKELR